MTTPNPRPARGAWGCLVGIIGAFWIDVWVYCNQNYYGEELCP